MDDVSITSSLSFPVTVVTGTTVELNNAESGNIIDATDSRATCLFVLKNPIAVGNTWTVYANTTSGISLRNETDKTVVLRGFVYTPLTGFVYNTFSFPTNQTFPQGAKVGKSTFTVTQITDTTIRVLAESIFTS